MLTFPYLKIFPAFSLFPLIIGDDSQNRTTSVDIDHSIVDGEQFIKKIADGEKVSEKPGLLMFTAPYKLCEGGCKEDQGGFIALGFPLYIGRRGKEAFKKIYQRDYNQLHKNNAQAPFKKSTTRATTTTPTTTTTTSTTTTTTEPPTCEIVTIIKYITVTTEPPPTTTTVSTTLCPYVPFGMCLKKIKQKPNHSTLTPLDSTTKITSEIIAIERKHRNKKQDNLDTLLAAVTNVTTNDTKNTAGPPVTHSAFKDENGELDSNYIYYGEVNNSSENIDKATQDKEMNIIDNNEIFKALTKKFTSVIGPKNLKEHNDPIIPRLMIKNPYINPNNSIFTGTKIIPANTFLLTLYSTTVRSTTATTKKNVNQAASILNIRQPYNNPRKTLWEQLTVIDSFIPVTDEAASNYN